MRTLERNKQPFHYCLYESSREVVDEYGNRTGEKINIYEEPVTIKGNISEATGQSSTTQFGKLETYDKVIVLEEMDCPIKETTVLFVDKEPEFTLARTHAVTEATALYGEDTIEIEVVEVPVPDYEVVRVAKSLNSVSIAIRKIKMS